MNAPKRYHRWALTLEPVLPAREVAVAYLGECGFDMFEPSGTGVVAHGEEGKVDAELAMQLLDEIRSFAEVACDQSMVEQENWNAQWEQDYPKVEVRDEGGALTCTIRAPFHAPAAEGMDVVVAPQMSFGTGHHATTHLMTASMLAVPLEGQMCWTWDVARGCWPWWQGCPRPNGFWALTSSPMRWTMRKTTL